MVDVLVVIEVFVDDWMCGVGYVCLMSNFVFVNCIVEIGVGIGDIMCVLILMMLMDGWVFFVGEFVVESGVIL